MVNYYSKFISNLASRMKPLYNLLKKDSKFVWSSECNYAFVWVKKEITSDKVLIHFDPSKPLRLSCDASNNGIGAALSHVMEDGTERLICFVSRVLTQAEKNYAMIQKEALSIYWAVQKLYQYLVGRKFEIASDHKPLEALFGEFKTLPKMAAGRIQRWSLFLSGFDYTFKYVRGQDNVQADALSRLPVTGQQVEDGGVVDYFNFMEGLIPIDSYKLRSETRKDPVLGKVFNYIRYGFPRVTDDVIKTYKLREKELSIEHGVIMWGS